MKSTVPLVRKGKGDYLSKRKRGLINPEERGGREGGRGRAAPCTEKEQKKERYSTWAEETGLSRERGNHSPLLGRGKEALSYIFTAGKRCNFRGGQKGKRKGKGGIRSLFVQGRMEGCIPSGGELNGYFGRGRGWKGNGEKDTACIVRVKGGRHRLIQGEGKKKRYFGCSGGAAEGGGA